MRTKLTFLILAFQLWGWTLAAQTNALPHLKSPPATNDVLRSIIFDDEVPLVDVIRSLAQEAHVNFQFSDALAPGGKPGTLLSGPAGPTRYEQISAATALDRVLAKHNLAFGKAPETGILTIAARSSTDAVPGTAVVASGLADPSDIESVFDPNKEVPLLVAIQALGKMAKLNILIDPKIKTGGFRTVGTNVVELPPVATNTVSLSSYGGVSAQQMLEAVLNNFGLTLITDPKTKFSQVTFRDPQAKEPMFTYVMQLRYSNTTNLTTLIQMTYPTVRVSSDSRTAQLVLLSTQRDYEAITNLVASLDTPTKQVLIEARFLETLQNPKSLKGIDWTDTMQAQHFTFGNGTVAGQKQTTTTTTTPGTPTTVTLPSGRTVTTSRPSTTQTIDVNQQTATVGQGISLDTAKGFNPATAFLNADGVNAALSFLNSEADSRTLATPRAVTLDNQETRLEVTRAIPIFDASTAIGQAGSPNVSSSKPNYTNIGTILVVTPRISGTNVGLKLRPEISRVEDLPSRKIINGQVNEADIFATSKIETHVMVPSGNTLVMGGLISDATFKSYTKVPILGDIPVLGWAFRHESKERSKANLIIFLTPTIIEDDDFQPTRTQFLNTSLPTIPEENVSYLDRGKAKPWGKKKLDADDIGEPSATP
jgi:type II secretory pathway component GspD/PulD (secretin)